MLLSFVEECGAEAVDLGIVSDKKGEIEKLVEKALSEADIVITSGAFNRNISVLSIVFWPRQGCTTVSPARGTKGTFEINVHWTFFS